EEAITSGIDFAAGVAFQRLAHQAVMLLDKLAPGTVAELGGHFGGPDDIGKEDGRQESLGLTPWHGGSLRASRVLFQGLAMKMPSSVGGQARTMRASQACGWTGKSLDTSKRSA